MLNIYYANKIEALAIELASLMNTDPLGVFDKEQVLLESAAMQQWLGSFLAQQTGLLANIEFPYPASFIWQVFRLVNKKYPERSAYERLPQALRMYEKIEHQAERLPQTIQQYVANLPSAKQRFLFAEHVAGLYDQYQIYRPQWLKKWQQGDFVSCQHHHWQGEYWQDITQEISEDDPDRASIFYQCIQGLSKLRAQDIPWRRLHIFAPSSLAQSYLQVFSQLADIIDINIYVLNPSYQFWLGAKKSDVNNDVAADGSNALLVLLGQQNKILLQQLLQQEKAQTHECFIETPTHSLLQHVQNSITHFVNRSNTQALDIDQSIQVHSCHHRLREVQVLHDQLLLLLNNDKSLQLQDIAIMVPDIDTYAPYFKAVFNANESLKLAFAVSEKNSYQDQPVQRTLIKLLQCAANNFRHSDIVALLEEDCIKQHFDIDDEPLLHNIMQALGIRFGLHDKQWHDLGERVVSFSFEQARKRLLQSYAQPVDDKPLLLSGIEGSAAESIGGFLLFIDALELLNNINTPRPLSSWGDLIKNIGASFFDHKEHVDALQSIQDILEKLEQTATLAKQADANQELALDFDVFMHIFEAELSAFSQQQRFVPNCINIASLLPMRALPFKAVCLLGMNEGDYPKNHSKDPLDLMLDQPQLGDRNRLDEQRYLFLQALLSAQQYFYISFIGQNAQDNSEQLPSVMVSELLKFIDKNYSFNQMLPSRSICHKHPLHAFDQYYFTKNSKQHSFQSLYQKQAELLDTFPESKAFAEPNKIQAEVITDANKLISILKNPNEAFLKTLNIFYQLPEVSEEDQESFRVDGLQNYHLLQDVFKQSLEGGGDTIKLEEYKRLDLLPQAGFAQSYYEALQQQIKNMQVAFDELGLNGSWQRKKFSIVIDQQEIHADFDGVLNKNSIAVLANKLSGRHYLQAWVQHLLLSIGDEGYQQTYLFGTEEVWAFVSIEKNVAIDYLQQLLALAQQFLIAPSWLFPKSAWQYMQSLEQGKDAEYAWRKFLQNIAGSDQALGEMQTLEAQKVYQGIYLTEHQQNIVDVMHAIFEPILAYGEKRYDAKKGLLQSKEAS